MSRRRGRRMNATGRMQPGDRFAQIAYEVIESDAYRALPAWAVLVLVALAAQYRGRNNGSLGLPWSDAQRLGVRTQAQLYGGLRILEATDLILCTRRGHLSGGRKLASLYALTWRALNEPENKTVTYDPGVTVATTASDAWAKWERPTDWDERVRTITQRARGQRSHACPFGKNNPDTQRGERSAHSVGSDGKPHPHPDPSISLTALGATAHPIAHSVGVTSRSRSGRSLAGSRKGGI